MVSVLIVDETSLSYLDQVTSAPAWPKKETNLFVGSSVFGRKGGRSGRTVSAPASSLMNKSKVSFSETNLSKNGLAVRAGIEHAALAILQAEQSLTQMDRIVGDGDCGLTFKRGAEAVLEDVSTYDVDGLPSTLCMQVGDSIRKSMGGSSGAILDIMCRAAAVDFTCWPSALQNGVNSASFYGGAKEGYRTMLDALIPAAKACVALSSLSTASISTTSISTTSISSSSKASTSSTSKASTSTSSPSVEALWKAVVAAASKGAESTKTMRPLAGRSSYVDQAKTDGTADPGAVAMAIMMKAFSDGYLKSLSSTESKI